MTLICASCLFGLQRFPFLKRLSYFSIFFLLLRLENKSRFAFFVDLFSSLFVFFCFSVGYLVWGTNRFRGVKNIIRILSSISLYLSAVKIMSDGYYNSKKTDDICDDVCGQVCLISILFLIFEITFLFEKSFFLNRVL